MAPSSPYNFPPPLLILSLLHRARKDVPIFLGNDGILCAWSRFSWPRSLLRYTPNPLSSGIIRFLFGIDTWWNFALLACAIWHQNCTYILKSLDIVVQAQETRCPET